MHSRSETAATTAQQAGSGCKGLHGEGLASKVAQALSSHGLEVRRLIVVRCVLMVCELHEQVPLQQAP